jgi:hypothetical protein
MAPARSSGYIRDVNIPSAERNMIILTIGEVSRRLADPAALEEGWVMYHMRAHPMDADRRGVHVRIDAPSITLNLSAGEPSSGGTIERRMTAAESRVVDLWQERGLDRPDFRSGQLVAFLHQLYDVLEQSSVEVPAARSAGLFTSGVPA